MPHDTALIATVAAGLGVAFVLGLLAVRTIGPRVPVTLELDVHLFDDPSDVGEIQIVGRITKTGNTVQVYSVDLLAGGDRRIGFAHGVFVAAPDARLSIPTGDWALGRFTDHHGPRLAVDFAERIRCLRTEPGTAILESGPEMLNSSNTLNGGLLAVAVEEAMLSTIESPATLSSLHMRYLRPVRTGPAVAHARRHGRIGEIEIRDAATDALAVIATAVVAG